MSESGLHVEDSLPQIHTYVVTAGSILREARERAGLHVAALAVSMKVPVKKLEALEADRLDLLPDAVFVRALAASVCRTLKIDSASVLELLPASSPPKLRAEGRGINTPFDGPRYARSMPLIEAVRKPVGILVGLLLVAAMGIYFFPKSQDELSLFKSSLDQAGATFQGATETQSVAEPVQNTATPPDRASLNGYPDKVEPSGVTDAPPSLTPIVSAENAPPKVADPLVTFKAKGEAWIQVTDAKGVQLISRTLGIGEVVGMSGALPMSVVVGRSDLTAVEVRGVSFDLARYSQNNVARFEIKP